MSFRKFVLQSTLVISLCSPAMICADGLPGEYLLTQRWRDMIAHHSPVTNPALMTEENYVSFRGAFAPILAGAFNHTEFSVVIPVGLYQSAGLTVLFSPEGVAKESIPQPDGSLVLGEGVFSNTQMLYMLSYSWHFWNKLSAGINAKVAYQTAFGTPATGVGIDIGFTYRLLHHPMIGDHLVGISALNLISPAMKIPGSTSGTGAYSRDLKVSWVGNYWERRLESALDIDFKDFWAASEVFPNAADGLSSGKEIEWDVNLKLGAWLLRLVKVYLQFGFDEDALDHWGVALGVNAPSLNSGRDLEFIYQYNIMTADDNGATGHSLNARVDIGKHREEIFARKMAHLFSLSPNELYNRARKLYFEKKYWDAFFVFSRILVEFPDFFKNDWVTHYRASCEEELDMRKIAITNNMKVKTDFPLSSAVPYTDLALMRIYYRNGDYSNVANQFFELSKPNVSDSLRYHGAYLMGQTHMANNDLRKAIEIFNLVSEDHPDYTFSQHAIAVCHARLGDETDQIATALENVIGSNPTTQAQKEIINRSYLFMGYLFYEENTLSKAVVALQMIPLESYYAEDALLGQGWTALKSRQWTDCITVGQLLAKTTKKPVLQSEGLLIQAYGYLLQKQYNQTLALLKTANDKIRNVGAPSLDSLNYNRMQYESNRMSHNLLAEKVDNLSLAGRTKVMSSQTDSLRNEQDKFLKDYKQYYDYSTEHDRLSFFARSIDQVREDIDYALVTVEKIAGNTDVNKLQQKLDGQQQKIDSEIEQLKKEMEKLQNEAK